MYTISGNYAAGTANVISSGNTGYIYNISNSSYQRLPLLPNNSQTYIYGTDGVSFVGTSGLNFIYNINNGSLNYISIPGGGSRVNSVFGNLVVGTRLNNDSSASYGFIYNLSNSSLLDYQQSGYQYTEFKDINNDKILGNGFIYDLQNQNTTLLPSSYSFGGISGNRVAGFFYDIA
jgi:hypothetical protein